MLLRPDFVDRIARSVHFVYQHNNRGRVRAIVDGMSHFMLSLPNMTLISGNLTLLEDHARSSEEICRLLVQHLEYEDTLAPDQLPLEVPLLLFSERMHTHQYAVMGSFEYVKKVNDANVIEIPYGHDGNGAQITNPIVIPPPVIAPVPPMQGGGPPVAPTAGAVQDPNAALLQGVLAAMQVMMQMNMQSDQQTASMTLEQSHLQAATMRANQRQLQHLTNHLGTLGTEVGKAIASHPTRIQATLSHPSAVPGQSNDPRQLGSLTRPIPVGMSVAGFDYGPYVQAIQPQPNDKNTRRYDKATHQIVQRHLPPPVKVRYNAAHTSGVVLPVQV